MISLVRGGLDDLISYVYAIENRALFQREKFYLCVPDDDGINDGVTRTTNPVAAVPTCYKMTTVPI